MQILSCKTHQDLHEIGANLIMSTIHKNSYAVLGLATGSTPIGIYEHLIQLYQKSWVSFENVTTFNLDEYMGLGKNHPQSYYFFMKKNLFDHININASQTHIPDGTTTDSKKECEQYEQKLEKSAGIDLQILGLGHNGHIGFNEPALDLHTYTHVVQLKEETRNANARFFNSLEDVPKQAITMGVGSIFKAKTILLVVKGTEKASILKTALKGPISPSCPASFLQLHPNLIVLTDKEAGKELS